METLTVSMVEAVKNLRKDSPEMSDTEVHKWIDEVIQDGVAMKEVSLKDYQAYQANPYGFFVRVLEASNKQA